MKSAVLRLLGVALIMAGRAFSQSFGPTSDAVAQYVRAEMARQPGVHVVAKLWGTELARESRLLERKLDELQKGILVVTGVSGSGKSSLAFGTIYAEAQRRYFESVAPYARRLLQQTGAPKVDDIEGLPPAVALQQRRGGTSSRSSVGTVTTLSNLLRMLFSRAGRYPRGATEVMGKSQTRQLTAI